MVSLMMRLAVTSVSAPSRPWPHLDAHRAIVLGDDQDGAVVGLCAADLPGLGEPDPELRDVLGLGRRQDQHRDLRALARLERRELFLERGLLRGRQRAGEIGDARLERRQRDLRVRRRRRGPRAATPA